jgi:hypothetical protein
MNWNRSFGLRAAFLLAVAPLFLLIACQLSPVQAGTEQDEQDQAQPAPDPQQSDLVIENNSDLPDTYPGAKYEVHFIARGGVPVLHWRLEKGALPPGLRLEGGGLLFGSPERAGEFQFTASVIDGGKPQQAVQKQFTIRVRSAMTANWKAPARVNNNRIEGSVEVSNTTADDIDLTFVVLAVASNGRATAIGYQHFVMAKGTSKDLPFGETLPHGGYVIHVDVVGEVAKTNTIYHQRLETSGPLQVTVGP